MRRKKKGGAVAPPFAVKWGAGKLFDAFPSAEVRAFGDPLLDEINVGRRDAVTLAFRRHGEVIGIRQSHGLHQPACVGLARDDVFTWVFFAAFHDDCGTVESKTALGLLDLTIVLVLLLMALEAAFFEDREDLLFKVHLARVLRAAGGGEGSAESKRGGEGEGEGVFHGWCETSVRVKMFTRIFRGQAATQRRIGAESQK